MNPVRTLCALGALGLLALAGCTADAGDDLGTTDDALLLLNGGKPMPCADPAPISTANAEKTWFVYCTGMNHVWKTSDWSTFSDVATSVNFDFGSLNTLGRNTNTWWAPSILYLPTRKTYALWVSVEDGSAVSDDRRSLAVFSGTSPTGPWTFERYGKRAAANGEHHIDPGLATGTGGAHWLYWKSYGGTALSAINGVHLADDALSMSGNATKLFDGYDMNSWEQHVRENPSVWENPSTGVWHMLYSGAAWADSSYATGHAFSTCGALCQSAGGWRLASAGDRGVAQVMQAKGDADFANGGPGGAAWLGNSGDWIVFAAAARSKSGDKTRYLFRQHLTWGNDHSPYVNTAKHIPSGF